MTKVRSAVAPSESEPDQVEIPTESPDSPPLDISPEFAESPQPKPRAKTRFGIEAKRAILRSGGALEKHVKDVGTCLFITGTLPGSTPEAYAAIANHADWIVHRLNDWVRYYTKENLNFYVWELQKRGALHIHYCVYVPTEHGRRAIEKGFRKEWCNLLGAVGKFALCNMFKRGFGDRRIHREQDVQVRVERVKKSITAYLAKYSSKQFNQVSKWASQFSPKRWWGRSRPLKTLTDNLTQTKESLFSSYNQATTYIRKITDDISVAAVKQYEYQHKCGAGMSTVTYVLESVWNLMNQQKPTAATVKMTPLQLETVSQSSLIKVLSELTEAYSRSTTSYPSSVTASVESLVQSARQRQSMLSELGFANVRGWILDLLAISSRLTIGRLMKQNSLDQAERLRLIVRALWDIQESGVLRGEQGWDRVEVCSTIIERRMESGTPAVAEVQHPVKAAPPALDPRVRQLQIPSIG